MLIRPHLTISLDAITANYRTLNGICGKTDLAAVVKANAYGLGAAPVARALALQGCRNFFVATLDEAIALRRHLPKAGISTLATLACKETVALHLEHRILPTLNSLAQIKVWQEAAHQRQQKLGVFIHLDTAMNRLGLGTEEQALLATEHERLDGLSVRLWISHLACSEDEKQPLNALQARRLASILARLPSAKVSFANSGGIFLGPEYRRDLARSGIALYGGNPQDGKPNPMQPVVTLKLPVLQVRRVDSGESVGYGATQFFTRPARLATLAAGYADGLLRSGSGRAKVYWGTTALPIVGRISMDLITIDVTALPEGTLKEGDAVEILGPHQGIDQLAHGLGTIAYEVITSLGNRYERRYEGTTPETAEELREGSAP